MGFQSALAWLLLLLVFLLKVVYVWEITSMLMVFRLWLFALLPWSGVGAFAGSA